MMGPRTLRRSDSVALHGQPSADATHAHDHAEDGGRHICQISAIVRAAHAQTGTVSSCSSVDETVGRMPRMMTGMKSEKL